MSKIIITLNKTEWKTVCDEIKDYYGLTLTPGQMRKVLSSNLGLLVELAQGIDEYGIGDTSTREEIVECIAQDLIEMNWPCGGTRKKDQKDFYNKLIKACKKIGYGFDTEGYDL